MRVDLGATRIAGFRGRSRPERTPGRLLLGARDAVRLVRFQPQRGSVRATLGASPQGPEADALGGLRDCSPRLVPAPGRSGRRLASAALLERRVLVVFSVAGRA